MSRVAWNRVDLSGQVFGRLTVIAEQGRTPTKQVKWRCSCICGGSAVTTTHKLRSGQASSCGCLSVERIAGVRYRHGLFCGGDHPLTRVYTHMIARCHNANDKDFPLYGGRGITVCDRWRCGEDGKTGFQCFVEDMPDRPDGWSIDRRDNDGSYSKENCRWATAKQQANNRRPARWTRWSRR